MQTLYNTFFGKKEEKLQDVLAEHIPEEVLEQVFCFTLADCQLFTIKSKAGRQIKECEFIESSLRICTQKIELEDKNLNMPVLKISND